MSEVLSRQLQALGLERKAKPGPTLQEYLAARYPAPREGAEPGP